MQAADVPPPLPPPKDLRLITLPSHDCNYLPNRLARTRAFMTHRLDPALYHDLMNAGFRRSGQLVYQPICPTCRACIPLRVPTARFTPSKSQRRIWRRNQDLIVDVAPPIPTEEKLAVYQRYLTLRHHDHEGADAQSFVEFLYSSPVETLEFTYRDPSGSLLAVGLCDICPDSLSSVYFYFDPAPPRGLPHRSQAQPRHFRRALGNHLRAHPLYPLLLPRILDRRLRHDGLQVQLPPPRTAGSGWRLDRKCCCAQDLNTLKSADEVNMNY